MILGAGLPISALLLMALSTITTNFVNLYLSALAVRNLWHRAPPRPTVLVVGVIGTLFGLLSPNLLDRYAAFMGWIGTGFLPIAAITVVHFFVLHRGPDVEPRPWSVAAIVAWSAGVATYQAVAHFAPRIGATVPTLVVTALRTGCSVAQAGSTVPIARPRSTPRDAPHRAQAAVQRAVLADGVGSIVAAGRDEAAAHSGAPHQRRQRRLIGRDRAEQAASAPLRSGARDRSKARSAAPARRPRSALDRRVDFRIVSEAIGERAQARDDEALTLHALDDADDVHHQERQRIDRIDGADTQPTPGCS